jgi:hypothetical protein
VMHMVKHYRYYLPTYSLNRCSPLGTEAYALPRNLPSNLPWPASWPRRHVRQGSLLPCSALGRQQAGAGSAGSKLALAIVRRRPVDGVRACACICAIAHAGVTRGCLRVSVVPIASRGANPKQAYSVTHAAWQPRRQPRCTWPGLSIDTSYSNYKLNRHYSTLHLLRYCLGSWPPPAAT